MKLEQQRAVCGGLLGASAVEWASAYHQSLMPLSPRDAYEVSQWPPNSGGNESAQSITVMEVFSDCLKGVSRSLKNSCY